MRYSDNFMLLFEGRSLFFPNKVPIPFEVDAWTNTKVSHDCGGGVILLGGGVNISAADCEYCSIPESSDIDCCKSKCEGLIL